MKGPLERDIQKSICQYLALRGYLFKRNNAGKMILKENGKNRMINVGESGWPDIFVILKNGRFCGIEVKRRGGIVTDRQHHILQRINEIGGMAFVAYDVQDVINRGI